MTLTWADVLARVTAVGLAGDDCVLAGSGPLLAHGLVDGIGDIDLVVSPAHWETLAAGHPSRSGNHGDRIAVLPGDVELFDGWHGEHYDAVRARAHVVDGLLVASLADTLAFKLRLARPKDGPHIEALRRALNSPEAGDQPTR